MGSHPKSLPSAQSEQSLRRHSMGSQESKESSGRHRRLICVFAGHRCHLAGAESEVVRRGLVEPPFTQNFIFMGNLE